MEISANAASKKHPSSATKETLAHQATAATTATANEGTKKQKSDIPSVTVPVSVANVTVGTTLTPISQLKSLFTPGKIISYRVEGGNIGGPSTYYLCRLSTDPINQATSTQTLSYDGNEYTLTKGQYYLTGEWYEMLISSTYPKGNRNWYVLSKCPTKGQGKRPWKCIVTLESILGMNCDMKQGENYPKDSKSLAMVRERGNVAYYLPEEAHKFLVKECHRMDEQEKEVRHLYAKNAYSLFSFILSNNMSYISI